MTWRIETSIDSVPQWAKWLNREAANAWRAEIVRLLADARGAASTWAKAGGDEPTQWRQVERYFAAVSAFSAALNIHPCNLAWYSARRQNGDPGEANMPGMFTDEEIYSSTYRAAVNTTLAQYSALYREQVADGDDLQITILLRVDLDRFGAMRTRRGEAIPGAPIHFDFLGSSGGAGSDPDRMWTTEADAFGVNDAETGGVRGSWQSTSWSEFDDGRTGYIQVFAPLLWSFELIVAVMDDIATHTINETVTASIQWMAVSNARTASVMYPAGEPGLPEDAEADIATLSAAYSTAAVTAPTPPAAWRAATGALGAIAAGTVASGVATPIIGPATALLGLAFGVPELLNRFFSLIAGVATGRGFDCWFRRQPYAMSADWTGNISGEVAPTQAIPLAPLNLLDVVPPVWGAVGPAPDESAPVRLPISVENSSTSGGGLLLLLALAALLLLRPTRKAR